MLEIISLISGFAFFVKIFRDGDKYGYDIVIEGRSWIYLIVCLLSCIISTIIYS